MKVWLERMIRDRQYLGIMIGLLVMALIAAIYVLLVVRASDIQLVTQYAGYADNLFDRGPWYSLYGFAVLPVWIAVSHSVLMVKLADLGHRTYGIVFGLGSILLIVVGILYAASVFHQIAYI